MYDPLNIFQHDTCNWSEVVHLKLCIKDSWLFWIQQVILIQKLEFFCTMGRWLIRVIKWLKFVCQSQRMNLLWAVLFPVSGSFVKKRWLRSNDPRQRVIWTAAQVKKWGPFVVRQMRQNKIPFQPFKNSTQCATTATQRSFTEIELKV